MPIDPKKTTVLDVVKTAREAARNDPPATVETTPATDAKTTDGEKAKPVFKAAYVSDDGVIYLIGAFAGNVDLDDDVLQTKALVKMSYDFCAGSTRTFKANHQEDLAADLVASMPGAPILKSGRVLAFGEDVPEDDEIVGIDLKAEPIAWFVGVRPHDKAIAEKAKAGEIAGASWGAYVQVEE